MKNDQVVIIPTGGVAILSGTVIWKYLGWTSIWMTEERDNFILTYEEKGKVIDSYPVKINQFLNDEPIDEREIRKLMKGVISYTHETVRPGAEEPYPLVTIREMIPGRDEPEEERDPNEPTKEEVVQAIRNLIKGSS